MAITKRITKGSSLTYQEMDDNLEQIAPRTSSTGSIQIPAGTTAQRDGSPQAGYLRYNNQLNQFEGYTTSWGALAGGGGGGGEVNQNAFSTFAVSGQTNIDADSSTDTINFAAGSNITLTTNASTDTLTIAASFSQDFAFSSITGTPTTVAGYGITDAQPLLVSGTNIKTINSQSILGSGDLAVTATADWTTLQNKPTTISGFGITDAFDGVYSSLTGTPTTLSGYGITDAQEILVSASNIKTINGVSILGSGDLTVAGSYGDSDVSAHLNTISATTGQVLSWNGIDFAWITSGGGGSESDPVVGAINGLVKADGAGNISAAVAGTDYSNFDGDWNSLTNTPTTLADAGIIASLLDLTNQNTNTINDGVNGQVLTTDGNGNFSFTTVGSGGSGATSFLGLSDTPNNYTGAANQVVTVNSQGTGLTYTTIVSGAESNDLSSVVTWTTVPDAYISNTSIVQHQADIRITESQITDLQAYLTSETDPVFSASAVANVVADATGSGFLRNQGGEWFYDNNVYTTSTAAETDPVFNAHTTSDIVDGTGFLSNSGQGANSWYYDTNTYIIGSDVPDNETDPVFSAATVSSITDGTGFLVNDGSGGWYYDTNTYVTSTAAETDPVFTAHTTYNIANGTGYLKNDGGGTWSYEANNFLTTETDPVFTAHTSSNIVDGEGFLRQDSANNWYFDANTYITANDIPATSATLDEVTTNGSSTTNSIEVGGLTVNGDAVALATANVSSFTNDANYITLTDLSASGDLTYDDTTGIFTANLQSTGITAADLTVISDTAGTPSLNYNSANATFVYTPPDLSSYLTSAPAEEDPIFMASGANNIVHGTGFLVGDGNGGWYFDSNTYLDSSGGGGIQTETDPVFSAHTTANITNGTGRLKNDGAGNWTYEANTFLESETDPIFTASTVSSITDGTGFLINDGSGNWSYDTSSYLSSGSNISLLANDSNYVTTATGVVSFPNDAGYITANNSTFNNAVTINGNFTVNDELTVNNDINMTNGTLNIAGGSLADGGKIVLNSGQTGFPSSASNNWSSIKVERGSLADSEIRWNEGTDKWQFTNDGSTYYDIPTTGGSTPTLDAVLGAGAETDSTLTLYRSIDGVVTQGSLIFESRDTTPNQNSSMGDIRFFMDTDVNSGTSTLGEYARISALKDSEWSSNVAGQIQFQVTQSGSLTSALRIGDAPAGGTPNATTFATNFENLPVWMENSLRVYETVDNTADITSDANISGLRLTAIDGLGNYKDRVSLSHQNNILRLRVTDRVNDDEYTELIAQPSATSMLSVNYKASGGSTSSYDVWTDYDGGQKVRTELTDENVLHKFGSYANTEYITTSADFGGFNGGSSGNADLVPSGAQIGSLAFFNWTDALNGTAGANRYIPAGHAEEVVHGMGILRDGGQHSLSAPRWDPFGGPDFRVSVDNTGGSATGLGGLVYMFGGTSISNNDTPVTTIITNQNYNATDATIISQTSYRTGQNTTTFDHEEYARVTVTAVDVTSGTEDAKIVHAVQKAGTLTDMLTVDPDGITIGASGGVVFADAGGSGTSTSNTLDSYEEGTFTPNLTGTGGAFSGATYGTQSGTYTKIGDTVHIHVHLVCSAVVGGSGSLAVGNLPFTIGGACGASIGYVSGLNVDETTYTQLGLYTTTSGGARLIFTKTGDNTAAGEVLVSEFTSAFNIVFTATYKV